MKEYELKINDEVTINAKVIGISEAGNPIIRTPVGIKMLVSKSDIATVHPYEEPPKDVEIKIENNEQSSPWLVNIRCDGCGKTIKSWNDLYERCPYCGKKHTFGSEKKEVDICG